MKPEETIDYHIKANWHAIANLYNQIADQYGLTQTSGYVLLNIDSKEGTPATKIAPKMGMKATSLSRILKTMEEDGLIYRQNDPLDKRLVRICLTDTGYAKQKIAKRVVKEFNEFIINKMDAKNLQAFYAVMEHIKGLIDTYKEKMHLL
jgi:DNA-binding MarR family transcriptional regulator